MKNYKITDSVDWAGVWHLPHIAEQKLIPGTLSWSNQRAILQMQGAFTPLRGAIYGDERYEYPVVHGVAADGNFVTILNGNQSTTNFSFGPAGLKQAEQISSTLVVLGQHVQEGTLYREVRATIPGLEIWIDRTGVTREIVQPSAGSGWREVYTFEHVPEEESEVLEIGAKLAWGIGRVSSGNTVSEVNIVSTATLRITTDVGKSLDWHLEQLSKVTTLLSFLAGVTMAPDRISARVLGSESDVVLLVALREAKYCTYKSRHDFFLCRNDMRTEISTVLAKWFEVYDRIAMPGQLALSVLGSEKLWLYIEFLSLMQALEGFHRATKQGFYTTLEQYDYAYRALTNAIPIDLAGDHKDALKSRIKYGNEISLRKRLDELAANLPATVRIKIFGTKGTVPQSWIATRNFYTHWDEASKAAVLDAQGMFNANVRMKHFLRVQYLLLIGIPEEALAAALSNSCDESQQLIQLNNAELRARGQVPDGVGAIMHINEVANEGNGETR